jgi:transposase
MNVRYKVQLTPEERTELEALTSKGSSRARKVKRALVLLACDQQLPDVEIAQSLQVGTATIYRIKRRFVEGGLKHALAEEARPGAIRKLSPIQEALLVATVCSTPPEGFSRWTLGMLASKMVQLTEHKRISDETIGRRLREKALKPWQKKMWCIPSIDGEYVARMEDVLELYASKPDLSSPVVCFDETPVQLIGETRVPVPMEPGVPERVDYEYARNGTANLFVFLDAHRPWREVRVTERRTNIDFAHCMRDLSDCYYPDAKRIRVVMDNLSTHKPGALYEALDPQEARRILNRLEFHYTPKHASWLNMVEIELSVLSSQCLDRRIPEIEILRSEIAHWVHFRNSEGARIQWLFNVEKAREKMGRAYPKPPLIQQSSLIQPAAA